MINITNGLVGGIIGALIALFGVFIKNKTDKSISFSDVITKERINTMNVMRDMIAQLCTLIYIDNKGNKGKILNCAFKIKMLITIHYEKEGNVGHYELEKELDGIIKNYDSINEINVKEKAGNMVKIARFIFDFEWNRIKREAK